MQSDIRRFLSPEQSERDQDVAGEMDRPAQPVIRRRRIVESEDDAQTVQPQNGNSANMGYNDRQEPPPSAMLPVFVLETTSEESADDIRVSPRMHPIAQAGALQPHARQLHPHLHSFMAASDRQHRPASRAGAVVQRGMQHQPQRRQRSQRRRFEEEAKESSVVTVHTDSSECSESDSDAADLYRSAIRGVRNARNARNQQRRRTEHCSVCAKFAAYLEHFI
jgi:hypothetical protein